MSVLLLGLIAALESPLLPVGDYAALPNTASLSRTETMPFGQCIALVDDVAETLDANPITVLRTSDVRIVRIEAADGIVILSCNRPENRMVLTKRPR
jgi:uncharacterized lipoprotein YmbA